MADDISAQNLAYPGQTDPNTPAQTPAQPAQSAPEGEFGQASNVGPQMSSWKMAGDGSAPPAVGQPQPASSAPVATAPVQPDAVPLDPATQLQPSAPPQGDFMGIAGGDGQPATTPVLGDTPQLEAEETPEEQEKKRQELQNLISGSDETAVPAPPAAPAIPAANPIQQGPGLEPAVPAVEPVVEAAPPEPVIEETLEAPIPPGVATEDSGPPVAAPEPKPMLDIAEKTSNELQNNPFGASEAPEPETIEVPDTGNESGDLSKRIDKLEEEIRKMQDTISRWV